MEVFIGDQIKTLAESFILGLIFSAGYDIIDIIHELCCILDVTSEPAQKNRKVSYILFLLLDTVYMMLVTVTYSVFLYHNNNGVFRMYLFVACSAGFVLYYHTFGRIFRKISEKVVRIIRTIINFTVVRPIRYIATIVWWILSSIVHRAIVRVTEWIRVKRSLSYMKKIRHKMLEYIKF